MRHRHPRRERLRARLTGRGNGPDTPQPHHPPGHVTDRTTGYDPDPNGRTTSRTPAFTSTRSPTFLRHGGTLHESDARADLHTTSSSRNKTRSPASETKYADGTFDATLSAVPATTRG